MSYRLIDANALNGVITDEDYEKVLNAPCIHADLPNEMNEGMYLAIPTYGGMTNGDMIKAMFPKKCPHIGFNENFGRVWIMENGEDIANFRLEWWNAPYKGVEG